MFSLTKTPLKNKTVLVRTDFNVPISNKKITDHTKIKLSLTTIKYILKNNCKIILMSHLGRPKGKIVQSLKMNIISKELQKLLPKNKITKLNDCIGKNIIKKIKKGKEKEIFLLENLRFYKEEKENDYAFGHSLAELADLYINDAFAASHRKHASIDAITKSIPSIPGFLLETEILNLSKALHSKKPATWLMGGAKLNKVELLNNALDKADHILIGGALAFPFFRAKKITVGHSLVNQDSIKLAKKILKHKKFKKIIFPIDFVCVKKISNKEKIAIRKFNEIKNDEIALDIGPKTIDLFNLYLKKSKTVVWNGPMGYFELQKFQKGTKELAKTIAKTKSFSICGGGETAEAIKYLKLNQQFTHISTGGGASLEFLSGKILPGIKALETNYQQFKLKHSKKKKSIKNRYNLFF